MKVIPLKLLILFFVSAGVFSCSDELLTEKNPNAIGLSSGLITAQAAEESSTVFSYFGGYSTSGGLETIADAPHGEVIVGIGISVNANRDVDRIVLATRAVNVIDGTLGTIENTGFGSVGVNDNSLQDCEVRIQVPQGNQIITEVGVASQGSDMAHIWVNYRDYDPATKRLGSTLYHDIYTRQSGVVTQRSFTVPSFEPNDRTVLTSIGLGCAGSTGRIDGFATGYGVFQ